MLRVFVVLILLVAVLIGSAYLLARRSPGPVIEIHAPARAVGASNTLDVSIQAPGGKLSHIEAVIEQNGGRFAILSLDRVSEADVRQEASDRVRITRTFTRKDVPALRPGTARLLVTATRPILFGLREKATSVSRDVQVRFEPPRLGVLSTHHYINHGGAELIVYRATPLDVESGVRVGEVFYPGYPASAARVKEADASVRVAFFALLHDQDLNIRPELYARDLAGNEARAQFDYRTFPKPFRRSRIELDDGFVQRVVSDILEHSAEARALTDGLPRDDLLARFLSINGELRRKNAESLTALAARTGQELRWEGPFLPLGGSQVESAFADHRTYFHQGREVDQQVHLGFDLAATANVPVRAANHGTVVYADYLGIYGNCVVIDHGLGLQSFYGHLSSVGVGVGQAVEKNQEIGRSGMTGLAGGDHLHFTMLLHGHPINPVEWWDPHWIEDRILRKLRAV